MSASSELLALIEEVAVLRKVAAAAREYKSKQVWSTVAVALDALDEFELGYPGEPEQQDTSPESCDYCGGTSHGKVSHEAGWNAAKEAAAKLVYELQNYHWASLAREIRKLTPP